MSELSTTRWIQTRTASGPSVFDAFAACQTALDATSARFGLALIARPDDDNEVTMALEQLSIDLQIDIVAVRTSTIFVQDSAMATDTGSGDGALVQLTVFGGSGFAFGVGIADDAELRASATRAAKLAFTDETGGRAVAIVVSDAAAGDQEDVVHGVYEVTGATIPIVGGCTADGPERARVLLASNGSVQVGTVAVIALHSTGEIGVGVRHGWRSGGEPVLVTEIDGTDVVSLDGRPALDVYLERTGAPAECHSDASAFRAFAATHPFGLARRRGVAARFVADVDFDRRSVHLLAPLPIGGLVTLLDGDANTVLLATSESCGDAVSMFEQAPPIGVLAFDCIARRSLLDDAALVPAERRLVSEFAGPTAAVAGFYTAGEFARVLGTEGFHNQTMVALVLS